MFGKAEPPVFPSIPVPNDSLQVRIYKLNNMPQERFAAAASAAKQDN